MITFAAFQAHDFHFFYALNRMCARQNIPSTLFYAKEFASVWDMIAKMPQSGLIVLWNGTTTEQQCVIANARRNQQRIAYCEHGPLPRTTAIDPYGINARSSIMAVDEEMLLRMSATPTGLSEMHGLELNQRWLSCELNGVETDDDNPLPARFVTLVLQVANDSQIRYFSPHFKTMGSLIDVVAQATQELGIGLVVKGHPSELEKTDYLDRVRLYPHAQYRILTPISLLLGYTTGVVTINSAVGAEAMIKLQQPLVLGEAPYSAVCPVKFTGNMAESIDNLIRTKGITELQERWLYYMTYHYLIPLNIFHLEESGCTAALQRILDIYHGKMPWLTAVT